MKKYSFLILLSIIILSFSVSCNKKITGHTTLADRDGTYKATSPIYSRTLFITINKDGTGIFVAGEAPGAVDAPINITIGNPDSTETSFNFVTSVNQNWTIDFDKNTLQSPEIGYTSILFTIKKQN